MIVSFKTAKLAKEKGFTADTKEHYSSTTKVTSVSYNEFPAATQAEVQKWLRDVHNIDVWAQPFVYNQSLPDESYSFFLYKDGVWQKDESDFLGYEPALEEGLIEALKLL